MNPIDPTTTHNFVKIPIEDRPIEVPSAFAERINLSGLIQKHLAAIKEGNLEPLAKEIAEKIEQHQGQIYILPGVQQNPLYNINWLVNLSVDPYDIMKSNKEVKFCILIRHNQLNILEVKLLTINDKDELCAVQRDDSRLPFSEQQRDKIVERWSKGPNEYAILYSSTRTYYRLTAEERSFPGETKVWKFYHFRPANFIETKRLAPFHHEAQPEASSGLCGLHALNAFIGCRQFSPRTLGNLVTKAILEGNQFSQREAEEALFPRNEQTQELNFENFIGLEVPLLKDVIDEMAKTHVHPGIVCETKIINCRGRNGPSNSSLGEPINVVEPSITTSINNVDRFILGLAGIEAHFLTFRKDDEGKWWKVDSKSKEQKSFENLNSLLDEIKKDYPHPYVLSFIIPDPARTHLPLQGSVIKV
ncbi:MAG: hypothetical protein LLG04_07850 [Parachlamydia sp.]|nr:hypothetical protein [Parachlamydia sp.]